MQIILLSAWYVNIINNLIKSPPSLFLETLKTQMLFVSFLLAASPGFQVERKLEVDDPSEVLQILQMQDIGMNFSFSNLILAQISLVKNSLQ